MALVEGEEIVRAHPISQHSKAQAEQVRAVSVERVRDRIGSVPAPIMPEVTDAPRLHLAL